jgi:hypothetical protein
MYRLIDNYTDSHPNSGNILMVKDANDRRFGVYLNQNIKKVEGSYYGSGESYVDCYLLKAVADQCQILIQARGWPWRRQGQGLQMDWTQSVFCLVRKRLCVFRWRVSASVSVLTISGGTFGLILDSTFSSCSSARSPAYDNEVLCVDGQRSIDKTVRFECIGLEVWGT